MITIRPSRSDDFPQIRDLLQQLWPGRVLNAETLHRVFLAGLTSNAQVYLSACDGSRVVGFASMTVVSSLRREGDFAHLDELVVDSALREQGIGSRLLDAVAAEALTRHCVGLELNAGFSREASHRWYEKRGFQRHAFHFVGPILSRCDQELSAH